MHDNDATRPMPSPAWSFAPRAASAIDMDDLWRAPEDDVATAQLPRVPEQTTVHLELRRLPRDPQEGRLAFANSPNLWALSVLTAASVIALLIGLPAMGWVMDLGQSGTKSVQAGPSTAQEPISVAPGPDVTPTAGPSLVEPQRAAQPTVKPAEVKVVYVPVANETPVTSSSTPESNPTTPKPKPSTEPSPEPSTGMSPKDQARVDAYTCREEDSTYWRSSEGGVMRMSNPPAGYQPPDTGAGSDWERIDCDAWRADHQGA